MIPLLLAQILGGALSGESIFTWGDRLQRWPLDGSPPVLLARFPAAGPGCAAADGTLFLLEGSRLVRRRQPYDKPEIIESETSFADCLPIALHRRQGVVIQHLFSQIRFYEQPARRGEPWPYRDLYSIYTNSQQGGLLPVDLDRDGHLDLFAGNYFMRNPGRPRVDWRIFAVNAWHDKPEAARASLAWLPPDRLAWVESTSTDARAAIFQRPADLRQLWGETRLPGSYDQPRVATGDLDGDAQAELIIGDRKAITVFWNANPAGMHTETSPAPVLALWVNRRRLVVLRPSGVTIQRPRK